MKSSKRVLRRARKLGGAMSVAGTNTRKAGELVTAARQVVAKRMAIGAVAMSNPLNADSVELAKIIPEKTRVFSQSGTALLHWSGELAAQMASFAAREMTTVAQATVAMAGCRTPSDVFARQCSFASAWFGRALSQSIALGSLAIHAQAAAMAPVHRSTTENAKRLSR
jgi:hypothetical protein